MGGKGNSPPDPGHVRGASVLIINPKYDFNVGGALRACAVFGAGSLLWTGERVKKNPGSRLPREERLSAYRHIHASQIREEYALRAHLNRGYTPVAVEVRENAEPLDTFVHPDKAIYLFGPEDGTLGRKWLSLCHRFVVIPSAIRSPLNLAAAVNVVLYDRYIKGRGTSGGEATGAGQGYPGHIQEEQHEQRHALHQGVPVRDDPSRP